MLSKGEVRKDLLCRDLTTLVAGFAAISHLMRKAMLQRYTLNSSVAPQRQDNITSKMTASVFYLFYASDFDTVNTYIPLKNFFAGYTS